MAVDWVADRVDSYLVPVVGLPRGLAEGVEVLSALWPADEGPAHIVIGDWNFRDSDLDFCIDAALKGEYSQYPSGHPILVATVAVLKWMRYAMTEEERTSWEIYPDG